MPVVARQPELAPTPVHESPTVEVSSGPIAGEDYTLVLDADRHPTVGELFTHPLSTLKGLGSAATAFKNHVLDHQDPDDRLRADRRLIPVGNHERLALTIDADPEYKDATRNKLTRVVLPGLTELDLGSGLMMSQAIAERHPEDDVIFVPTLGVSMGGEVLSIKDGLERKLSETADDNRELIKRLANEGPVQLSGTSLGSYLTMQTALGNLSANNHERIEIGALDLVSPAVGAKNIPEDLREQYSDANDKEMIDQVTSEFFAHMPVDAAKMFIKHPEKTAECAAVLAGYALHFTKLPQRVAAMIGNLRGVQEGMEWDDILEVAYSHDINVLGGSADPLVQKALPQWDQVKKRNDKKDSRHSVEIRVLAGLGHAMTVDAAGIAYQLDQMERPKTPDLSLVN